MSAWLRGWISTSPGPVGEFSAYMAVSENRGTLT